MKIKNVFIFVADAFRWDHSPDSVLNKGASFKTVAAGTSTHSSMSSIVTGTRPTTHKTNKWGKTIPTRLSTIFDLENFNIGYYNQAGENDALDILLKENQRKSLKEMKSPFIFLERDMGGHEPYEDKYRENIKKFWKNYTEKSKIKKGYKNKIEKSIQRFKERLKLLKNRGLLKETLVIFTSDHGELLGEEGIVGHNTPLLPQLVYVPTVFIHPELDSKHYKDRIIGHIDILPTALRMLKRKILDQCEGKNIFSKKVNRRACFSSTRSKRYRARGVWDYKGGYTFNQTLILYKFIMPLAIIIKNNWKSVYVRNNLREYFKALKNYIQRESKFGKPDMKKAAARKYLQKILAEKKKYNSESTEMDKKIKNRLKQLGYT